jgi:hypothetical protein
LSGVCTARSSSLSIIFDYVDWKGEAASSG